MPLILPVKTFMLASFRDFKYIVRFGANNTIEYLLSNLKFAINNYSYEMKKCSFVCNTQVKNWILRVFLGVFECAKFSTLENLALISTEKAVHFFNSSDFTVIFVRFPLELIRFSYFTPLFFLF